MVWLLEKMIVHHTLDVGWERVEIPIRVKFEFQVRDGCLLEGSLSRDILYNATVLTRRYPHTVGVKECSQFEVLR
jgi:hypothetical protein